MNRLIVGMSGASGAVIGIRLLESMRHFSDWETHLILSRAARQTIRMETEYSEEEVCSLASCIYSTDDVGACVASGTFKTSGMAIVPCSMKTVAGIAIGYSENLLLRAADVALKEKRRLVVVARETPLNAIHLRNMLTLAEMGAMILPPMLSFYNRPDSVQDQVDHIVGKILNSFDLEWSGFRRWK
ncbi:MAG: UbiX family flavin prenyltransferase [Veillonellaceae bacterium]|nr:UbiX family flavin prenyltransferase [Veillonellaceae bacterium]